MTAPATPRPSSEAVAEAMRLLENDICELRHMAHILADMLDHDLTEYGPAGRISMPERGGTLTVLLTYSQLEELSFAWNNVASRAEMLRRKFCEAGDGKGGAR